MKQNKKNQSQNIFPHLFSSTVPCQRTPCVVSVMTVEPRRSCCPPVTVLGPWLPSTAAVWNTGCLPQEPASVSSATTSSLCRGSPGHCLRYRMISEAIVRERFNLMIYCITFDLEFHGASILVGGSVDADPRSSSGEAHSVW